MALTATTLAADIAAGDTTIRVTSGTGFPSAGATIANPGYLCRVNGEYFYAIQQPTAGVIKVRGRGSNGTAARAHDILSSIEVSADPADFGSIPAGASVNQPPYLAVQDTIGEDITYTAANVQAWGNQPRNIAIVKGSAAAITLAAPTTGQDGLTVVFTNDTAFAHVITATTLLADAVSGSPHTTATFAAFKGSSLTLQAQRGLWNVIAAVVCPIT